MQEYVKLDNKRMLRLCIKYCILKRVSLSRFKKIFETFLAASEKVYNLHTLDLDAVNGTVPPEDIAAFAKVFRNAFNAGGAQETKLYLKATAAAKAVKYEKVMAKNVPVFTITPPGAIEGKELFHIHGGGWMSGTPEMSRAFCTEIALMTKLRVVSVEYRLFPEQPHPAQIEDVAMAYDWLLESGSKPENIVIGGESAGGHLSLLLLNRLKINGNPLPAGAILLSPPIELSFPNSQLFDNIPTDPVLGTNGAGVFLLNMLRGSKVDYTGPEFSPVHFDMTGFPPLLVQASTCEMLYFDALTLRDKAEAAGVDLTLQTWDGVVHAFQVLTRKHYKDVKDANTKIAEFLGKTLSL